MEINMNKDGFDRLTKAKKIGKWGHLESWEELFYYQASTSSTLQQIIDIANVAKRKRSGENITLPYMKYIAFSTLGEKK
jgi:hypothetical protein